MYYLLTQFEIDKLAAGKLKPADVMQPRNAALLTWSGVDLEDQLPNITADEVAYAADRLGDDDLISDSVNNVIDVLLQKRDGNTFEGTDR